MSQGLTRIDQLARAGLTDPGESAGLEQVAENFRVLISPAMTAAIATPDDGVGRQFVPTRDELTIYDGDLADPIGDHAHAPVPGLTHRYPDRAILHLTQTCAVYCRFCFRRESVGDSGTLPMAAIDRICDYLRATPQIREIILTGGDPLVLSPRRLREVLEKLRAVGTLDLLRIHSRVPVVAPERVTPELMDALKGEVPVWIVVHTNHAQELSGAARAALSTLVDNGFPLLSQTVLLRGVNDSSQALEDLFRALLRLRVKPYYLHHCDLARGAGHFRTTIEEGMALMAALRGRISGTALPAYILDIPGGFGKVPITPAYFTKSPEGWAVTDPNGGKHSYSDPMR